MKVLLSIVPLLFIVSCTLFQKAPVKKIIKNYDNESGAVLIVAHRANIYDSLPENSLEGIQACITAGIDIVEIDIRMTKDGHLILMHDETLNRMTTGRGKVNAFTLAEIQQLKLRDGSFGIATNYSIPTLAEVFAVCKGKIMINLDKGFWFLKQATELSDSYGVSRQVILKSYEEKSHIEAQLGTEYYINFMPILVENSFNTLNILPPYLAEDNLNKPEAFEMIFDEATDSIGQALFISSLKEQGCRSWVNTLSDHLSGGNGDNSETPEIGWQAVIDLGFTIIQTDRCLELKEFLGR
jgi:glycerophosphoryl diester phosphodiesterase